MAVVGVVGSADGVTVGVVMVLVDSVCSGSDSGSSNLDESADG